MDSKQDTGVPQGYSPAGAAPPPEKASLVEDFIDVFYAPAAVFARRERASAWPYILIISALSALFVFASRSLMTAVFGAEFDRSIAEAMADNPRLTEEMAAQQRGISEMLAMVGSYLGMPLLIVLGALLIWIGARLMSVQLAFSRAVLVAAIAQIPRLLGALFTAIHSLLLTDTSSIASMHDVGYSPARFLDSAAVDSSVLALIARFDLFTLWTTLLLGIGVAVMAKVPRNRGLAAAAIAWAFPTVVTLAGALLG